MGRCCSVKKNSEKGEDMVFRVAVLPSGLIGEYADFPQKASPREPLINFRIRLFAGQAPCACRSIAAFSRLDGRHGAPALRSARSKSVDQRFPGPQWIAAHSVHHGAVQAGDRATTPARIALSLRAR